MAAGTSPDGYPQAQAIPPLKDGIAPILAHVGSPLSGPPRQSTVFGVGLNLESHLAADWVAQSLLHCLMASPLHENQNLYLVLKY